MKKLLCLILLAAMLLLGSGFAELSADLEIHSANKYGNAVLNIWADDFEKLGFELGDEVTVEIGDFCMDMPYLDGFYVFNGEYLVRRSSDGGLTLCINYGNFMESTQAEVGDAVRVTLKEKAGSMALQGAGSLRYTDDPADYASDEIFANHRMLCLGNIAEGKIFRSASPINNDAGRASTANALMEKAGIKAVMNLADSDASIREHAAAEDFDSAYYMDLYENGKVIVLDMDINFYSENFNQRLIKGMNFLAEQEGPYLIHCNEGKDRAGFASALIAALMGASAEEITADYMQSYVNYYHIDPVADAERYNLIMQGNILEMLRHIAGLEKGASLEGVDLAAAARAYLLAQGMPEANIEKLMQNLSA